MTSLSLAFALTFICITVAVDPAMALVITPSTKHLALSTLSFSHIAHPHLELALLSVFTTALLFSVVWAYILAIWRGAGPSDFHARPSRNAALRHMYGLPFSLPFMVRHGSGWAIPHRVSSHPVRGGLAYSLSASRRGRWYQHPSAQATMV
ncbi:hypothetical protein F5148DRAFT_342201 [Russula earlei]|uniref:Uncharacterized protein n=1 Tax=Russula earlei TaxID=71964 RepID=A0ACC0U267_9AGAM|nr:hypothetical protein F5148DRAFT_342201 [Russula earlei]